MTRNYRWRIGMLPISNRYDNPERFRRDLERGADKLLKALHYNPKKSLPVHGDDEIPGEVEMHEN